MMKLEPVHSRLKAMRERAGYSTRDISDLIDRPHTTYSSYEASKYKKPNLPFELVEALAPHFEKRGIPAKEIWMLAGTPAALIGDQTVSGARFPVVQREPDYPAAYNGRLSDGMLEIGSVEYVSIARFDAALSAGAGSLLASEPEPLGYHLVEASWLRTITTVKPEHLAVVMVDGDSMETTLLNRDWVLLDMTQKRLGRSGIYGFRVQDEVWVKRTQLDLAKKKIQLISDNPRYPMQELDEDELQVLGKVVTLVARRM